MAIMNEERLAYRYFVKILSSIFIAGLNIIIQILLPRALSVDEYGYYSYNLNVFTSVVTMCTLSAPSALVSKFSKRNNDIGIVKFYFKFFLIIGLLINVAIIVLDVVGYTTSSFQGQTIGIVLLGLEAALLMRVLTDCVGIFDAMAVSKFPAILQVVLKVMMCAFVIGTYLTKKLNLYSFYIAQCIITLIIVVVMLIAIYSEERNRYSKTIDCGWRIYAKEYWIFCRPLIIYSLFSQLVTILMNYELMKYGGTTEQAMFGVAWQLNTLVSYIFSPYAELCKREFSILISDMEQLRYRYIQSLRLIVWLTSGCAVFIAGTADNIIYILYGNKYMGAVVGTVLIMYYTVYQALGQISGSFLVATERTRDNALVGTVNQVSMFLLMFLFQIPNIIWDAGLGSTGIALTYLGAVLVCVNFTFFLNSRFIETSFFELFRIQLAPLLICTVLIIIIKLFFGLFDKSYSLIWIIVQTCAAGLIYVGVIGVFLLKNPNVMGIEERQINNLIGKINNGRNQKSK